MYVVFTTLEGTLTIKVKRLYSQTFTGPLYTQCFLLRLS